MTAHTSGEATAKSGLVALQTPDMAEEAQGCSSAGIDDGVLEEAISQILAENSADFKDFLFPSMILNLMYNRMHSKIKGRLLALLDGNIDLKDILKAYRSQYSKKDDIKFISNSFKELELQGRYGLKYLLSNPKPSQDMTAHTSGEATAKSGLVALQTPDMAEEAQGCSSAGIDDGVLEEAISQILAENSADFKDFLFPSMILNLMYNRMHSKIKGRLLALLDGNIDLKDILKAYRSQYSKKDDIKFISNSFKELELQGRYAKATASNIANANTIVMQPAPHHARDEAPLMFDEPVATLQNEKTVDDDLVRSK